MEGAVHAPGPQLTGELVRLLDGSLRIEDFIATMVHEAAQPLTAIQVLVAALRERDDLSASERERLLDDIDGQAAYLRALSSWMLDPFSRQVVFFDDLVGEIVERCRACAPGNELLMRLDADGLELECETVRVEASLRNLIKNAVTHTEESAPIEIATSAGDGLAIVRVANSGPAIPEVHWQRIFQPYTRVCEKSVAPGQGLGLFVVDSCAKNHGGHARVVSSGESGTTIELALRAVA